jgi:hypothetical protein
MLKIWRTGVQLAVTAIAGTSLAVEPPAVCRSQCELAGRCEQIEFDEYPDFETTREEFSQNCGTGRPFIVEGMCANGRKLIASATGFTSEIRLYSTNGDFEGLITQTDVVARPCMGQSFWPEFLQCEAPTVTADLCGDLFEVGAPAFEDRWN